MRSIRLTVCSLLLLTGLVGCSGGTGGDAGTGGKDGGAGGGTASAFDIIDLDPAAREDVHFNMTYDPATARVGVAYFTPRGTTSGGSDGGGVPDYDLKYVEYNNGTVGTPQTVRYVQRMVGVSVAFQPGTGKPHIALLGGEKGFVVGQSIYWFQNDAVIDLPLAGTTWTETRVATTGDQVKCNNPVSDRGLLVGMWPSIVFDSTGKLYFAYRDGHDGQFGPQDSWGSDLELWEGTFPTLLNGKCLIAGGNNKQAYGGHNQLVIGPNDQPAIVSDRMLLGWDTAAQDVMFQKRNADGTWTAAATVATPGNTDTGPSLAWDTMVGFGIAVMDRANHDQLSYLSSKDGTLWNSADPVFGFGSGGWYPSLAMDPINHEPAIAFYVCSDKTGVVATACPQSVDELRISQRNGVSLNWNEVVVDPGGGWAPKMGFFTTNGKARRFVVYRVPPAMDDRGFPAANVGALKLAVERVP